MHRGIWQQSIGHARRLYQGHWLWILAVVMAYGLALSRYYFSGYPYLDDLSRDLHGEAWSYLGRYGATVISWLWSGAPVVLDLSPLSNYCALGVMAVAALLALATYQDLRSGPWPAIVMVSLAVFNPYALQLWIYRYDAFPYAWAFLAVALALLLCRGYISSPPQSRRSSCFTVSGIQLALLLVATLTYPIALGWWFAGVPLLIVQEIGKRRPVWSMVAFAAAVSFGVVLITRLFFAVFIHDSYVQDRSDLFVGFNLITGSFWQNISLFGHVLQDFSPITLPARFILLLILLISAIFFLLTPVQAVVQSSRPRPWRAVVLVAAVYAVWLFALVGPAVAFDHLLVKPRILACSGFIPAVLLAQWRWPRPTGALLAVFILSQGLAFSATYAKALDAQLTHNSEAAKQIARLIALDHGSSKAPVELLFLGQLNYAPQFSDRMRLRYPILGDARYVPVLPQEGYGGNLNLIQLTGWAGQNWRLAPGTSAEMDGRELNSVAGFKGANIEIGKASSIDRSNGADLYVIRLGKL